MTDPESRQASQEELQEMIAETDTGARNPTGAVSKNILFYVPLSWTLFQLWYASPLPFIFNIGVFNSTKRVRSISLLPFFWPLRLIPLSSHRPVTTFLCRTGSLR